MGDVDLLVLTRLSAPPLPESMLTRPRLNRELTRAHSRSVTLVRAPAGFGKTTAVADWIHRHEETDRFVWLTAETEDDEPQRFWTSFVDAVATTEPAALADLRQKLNGGAVLNRATLAGELVNSLCAVRQPITVAIDDFEKISNPDVMKWLAFIARAMPANVHLVLCSRSEPDLPLSAWRAEGRLSEITTEDLRFTDREAGAYLDTLVAGAISEEQERALLEKAQGWTAALYLAALGIQHAPDTTAFIDGFDGGHDAIADYIVDEVLAGLPEGMRSFLLETSITPSMSPAVCDAITDRADSAAMLRALVTHGLFITADRRSGRWSYHPLFREVLRTQLANSEGTPDLADLHERASKAYLNGDDYAAALDHAIAANAWGLARKILEDHHRGLLRTNPKALRTTLAAFPDEYLTTWPQGRSMQIAAAGVLADTHSLQAIVGREAIGGSRTLEFVAKSVLSYLEGDYVQLEKLLPRSARAMHPVARTALRGLAATANEQYESGATTLRSAAGSHMGDGWSAVALNGILAWNRVRAGYLNMGTAFAQRALSCAATEGTRWFHWVRWAELAQAHASFDRGQLDDASRESRLLTEAETLDGWSRVEAHILAARISWASGDRNTAAEHFAAASLAPTVPVSSALAEMIALAQAQMALLDGDIELAAAWMPDWQTRVAVGPTGEQESLVVARLLIESGRFEEALGILEWAGSDSPRSIRYLVEAEKLKAITASRSGDSSAPLLLEIALAMARAEGLVQTFVDDWRALAEIGSASDIAVVKPMATSSRSVLLNRTAIAAGSSAPVEPLTDRELAVLRLLPTRMTNQEIAEDLFISINTVKTHVKSIYRKLNVGNRSAAVDAAVSMYLA